MKKVSKKALSLLSASLFFVNVSAGIIGSPASAMFPSRSSSSDHDKYTFKGDDKRTYKLIERIGAGAQADVFKCICEEDSQEYVVKIAKEGTFDAPPLTLDEAADTLKHMKVYTAPSIQCMQNSPPARPVKTTQYVSRIRQLGRRGTPFYDGIMDLDSPSESGDLSSIRKSLRFDEDSDDAQQSSDKSDSSAFEPLLEEGDDLIGRHNPFHKGDASTVAATFAAASDEGCANPLETPRKRQCTKPIAVYHTHHDYSSHPILFSDAPSFTTVDSSAPVRDSSPTCAAACPPIKPDLSDSITHSVVDERVRSRLNEYPHVTGLVDIPSYSPHIECKYPQTLESVTKDKSKVLSEEQVFTWANELLDTLIGLHNKHLCHQDIKPDNIFITKDGHMRLGDLGFLSFRGDCVTMHIGISAYMSPEMNSSTDRAHTICDRADVFSLGLVVLEMLTNFDAQEIPKDLQPGSSALPRHYAIRNRSMCDRLDSYMMRNGEPIPAHWKNFFMSCFNPDPNARATAQQAKDILNQTV